MSPKLMIMPECIAPPLVPHHMYLLESESLFYKFETCQMKTYYVEVQDIRGCLTAAIERLRREFSVNADSHCRGCQGPLVQKITVVSASDVPEADGVLVFVAFR